MLNGTMFLGKTDGSTYGHVYFTDSNGVAGSLTGTATVLFGGWGIGSNFIENDSGQTGTLGTLTIGAGITIHG